jgi:dATP pyrophosphohydrolase
MTDPTIIQVHMARHRNDTTEYLIIKRSDDREIYPGIWQVVTGMIEPNESAQQAALREFHEETGLRPLEFYCLPYITSFFSIRRNQLQHVPVFAAIVSDDAEVILSDEHSEFKWVSFEECLETLPFPSHKEATEVMREYIMDNHQANLFRVT